MRFASPRVIRTIRSVSKDKVVDPIIKSLFHGLVVSCQALPDEPLYGSAYMAAMARAALMGGAVGIRANTPVDIAAIHHANRCFS